MEEAVDGVGDEEGEKECCFKKSKQTNALSKCSFVKLQIEKNKLKAVSDTVWVCWKAMIAEKTITEKMHS